MSDGLHQISNKFPWEQILAEKQENREIIYQVYWIPSGDQRNCSGYSRLRFFSSIDNNIKFGIAGC